MSSRRATVEQRGRTPRPRRRSASGRLATSGQGSRMPCGFHGTDAPARTGDPQIHNREPGFDFPTIFSKPAPKSAILNQWVSGPSANRERRPVSVFVRAASRGASLKQIRPAESLSCSAPASAPRKFSENVSCDPFMGTNVGATTDVRRKHSQDQTFNQYRWCLTRHRALAPQGLRQDPARLHRSRTATKGLNHGSTTSPTRTSQGASSNQDRHRAHPS